MMWAIVYVPSGSNPGVMNIVDGSPLYEPSQFVIDCGTFDHDAGPLRIRSRMARILHPGDRVFLVYAGVNPPNSAG